MNQGIGVKLSTREKVAFGMGSVGNNLIYGLVTSYLLLFYTDVFGITAAVAGVIIACAKIWDGINDTFMGIVVDNTKTKFGRFRPYLLFVPVIMAIATISLFSVPNIPYPWKIAYAAATYVLWGMSFTAMDIPYWSMSASITQDIDQRSKVIAISRAFATIANIIAFVITIPLVQALGNGNESQGWQRMAMVFGLMAIVFTWITFFNVKERVVSKNQEPQNLNNYVKQLKENDALRWIILSMLVYEAAFAFKFAFVNYYVKYNFGAMDMIPLVMGVVAIGSIVGSYLAATIGKKYPRKKIIQVSVIIQSVLGLSLFVIGYRNLIPFVAINAVLAIFDGMCLILFYTLISNTVEYGEYVTGQRREGVVFSINIFKNKIAGALGIGLGALMLQLIGFVANVEQSVLTLNGIHMCFTIIPAVLILFVQVPLRKYQLTDEKYHKILSELSERAEKAA